MFSENTVETSPGQSRTLPLPLASLVAPVWRISEVLVPWPTCIPLQSRPEPAAETAQSRDDTNYPQMHMVR